MIFTKNITIEKELIINIKKAKVIITKELGCLDVLVINGRYGKRSRALCGSVIKAVRFIKGEVYGW